MVTPRQLRGALAALAGILIAPRPLPGHRQRQLQRQARTPRFAVKGSLRRAYTARP
jgi:hypothetical protein